MDLRSDVQLTAEEAILQINDISTKIIEKVDDYEKELIEFNRTNSKFLDGFNQIIKELESFYTVIADYLKQLTIDDEKKTGAPQGFFQSAIRNQFKY